MNHKYHPHDFPNSKAKVTALEAETTDTGSASDESGRGVGRRDGAKPNGKTWGDGAKMGIFGIILDVVG